MTIECTSLDDARRVVRNLLYWERLPADLYATLELNSKTVAIATEIRGKSFYFWAKGDREFTVLPRRTMPDERGAFEDMKRIQEFWELQLSRCRWNVWFSRPKQGGPKCSSWGDKSIHFGFGPC